MQRKTIFLLVIAVFMASSLFGGTTGKLAGKVKNQEGLPVAYANVFIPDLEIGAQTNEKGQYIIINIVPGVYTVQVSGPGYQSQQITEVKINLDETTMQNIVLNKASFDLGEMKVVGARTELVSSTKTSSGNTISSETIDDIAVDDIEGIVAIQAGAQVVDGELHVRGGRPNEVVFSIDGMSVSDPVDGGAALNIDTDAIKDMKVYTGGFSAEFGNAQSGIVNIITKSGSDVYSGKIELSSDHLMSDTNSNSDLVKFSFGGPVLGKLAPSLRKNFTFFFNGGGNWHDSFYKDLYNENPNDAFPTLISSWNDFEQYDPYEDRDDVAGFEIGDRNYNNYNANLKLKYKFNSKSNITLAIRGDQSDAEPFSHDNKYALEYYARTESSQNQYIATFDHVFNPQMNLQVKASFYNKETNQGPNGIDRGDFFSSDSTYFDLIESNYSSFDAIPGINYLTSDGYVYNEYYDYNWQYETEDGNTETVPFTKPGALYGTFIDDENQEMALKADFEYQVNQTHGLKSGFELKKHNIKKDRLFNPWVINTNRFNDYLKTVDPDTSFAAGDTIYVNGVATALQEDKDCYSLDNLYNATIAASGEADGYEADPWQGAFYIQDKMEWEGMIVNAGVRFDIWYLGGDYDIITPDYTGSYLDYIDPDSEINSEYYIPDADPDTDEYNYTKYHDAKDYYKDMKDKFETPEILVSPRLGISHPISEKSVVHFAYNYQRQLPQMQYVFTTGRPQDLLVNPSLDLIVGNPELEAQTTVTYEAGLSHQLSENYVLDITTYYKNIYNYVSTDEDTLESVTYNQYVSEDYGSARGIDLNLQKMYSNFISGSASYSLTWANGNHSETTAGSESLREFPLNWDIRHSFNLNLTFKIPNDEEFIIPFTDVAVPFDDFSANFGYNLSSGKPYTAIDENDNTEETNDELMPSTQTANLKLKKNFALGERSRFSIYLNIDNLFNNRNYYAVYGKTGSPYYSGTNLDTDNDGYVAPETIAAQNLIDNDPRNYSHGRTYTAGISFNW